MSLERQTATLGDNFIGAGNSPDLTPFHQVVLQTGMMGSIGGLAFRLPIIWGNLRKISDMLSPRKFWDLSEICA